MEIDISNQNMEMKPHRSKSMHMKLKSPIKIDAYGNEISNKNMEPDMEKKSHRSKFLHKSMKFQIKIDVYANEIS